jgi:hypothetical protein
VLQAISNKIMYLQAITVALREYPIVSPDEAGLN